MNRTTISRRDATRKAATAIGGGTAAILGGNGVAARAPEIPRPRQVMMRDLVRAYPLERTRDAVQDVADRTVVAAVVVFA